ncbi:SLBB domain-containing protein [uncultured Brevundimonas sp.]|uniref:SLBB domain-containing protein n=1 Tax=uncultured Brevundimonas sp. TaxID=213418 RepID=UPI0030EB12FA
MLAVLVAVLGAAAPGTALAQAPSFDDPFNTRTPTTGQAPNNTGNTSSNDGRSSGSGSNSSGNQSDTGSQDQTGYQPVTVTARDRQSEDSLDPDSRNRNDGEIFLPPPPGEFELYVEKVLGKTLPRFGASLLVRGQRSFNPAANATVPPDYRLNPGDTVYVGLAGSVEGNLDLTIDNNGRVFVPRVGSVMLAGVRYGDLERVMSRALGREFRDFTVSASVSQLRGIRVYVTGYAASPGAYSVTSLSTMINAVLAAGGPASGGSFRNITLTRNGRVISTLDFYDLLLSGDKSHDAVLQNEDVIHIGPVGAQVAVTGSVNNEAIYEAVRGETLSDVLRYAGGFNSVADSSRAVVAEVSNLEGTGWLQLNLSEAQVRPVERGAIVRILSAVGIAQPRERQAVLVTIEGEVERPGNYYLEPGSTLADAMARAGPLSNSAYLYGTRFLRESSRLQQEVSFKQAIADLELQMAALPLVDRQSRGSESAVRMSAVQAVINRLSERRPDGRIVLGLSPQAATLPLDFPLENNDRINIPPRPATVGVFGAVYQPGSFVERPNSTIGDYLALAGGPRAIADSRELSVIRVNGSVISARQGGWFHSVLNQPALPGDVIFVPVRTQGSDIFERLLQISTLLYQGSIGILAIQAIAK